MHYVHEQGLVHRDLKPANILFTPVGDPKITDFGLFKQMDGAGRMDDADNAIMGTPSYMPPDDKWTPAGCHPCYRCL